ncbi:MAG: sigma-70 family RNA polymerase sigma factor [Clostridia bacterium]|nr:sigma-70 family RNA polymerase sigma factor [Clostridia bacterium]
MVYRLARVHMGNPADADDVFQDVFLKFAEKSPDFSSEEHLRAWLIRVTLNRCRSHYRSNWWKRIAPLEDAVHAVLPAPKDPMLDEALDKLPSRYRTVIHLHYFENYDTSEIAALTGQRSSTVRSQLTRARQMLALHLKGEADA